VLAVGDAAFSRKCHDALADMKKHGKTLLFVSHAAGEVARFCDEVIYLSKGEAVARGTPSEVLDEYMMTTMSPKYFQAASPAPEPEPEQIPVATLAPAGTALKSNRRPLKAGTTTVSRFWRFGAGANQGELTLALLNPGEKSCKLQLHTATETASYTLPPQTPAVIKVNSSNEEGFSLDAESAIAVQEWPESLANGGPKVSAPGSVFPLWDLRADSEARLSIFNPGKSSCGLTVMYFQPEQEVIKRSYLAQPGKALLIDPTTELGADKAWADGGGGVDQTNAPCIGIYVEATAPVLVEKLGFEQTALPLPEGLELKPRDRATIN
jgi:hypothetical protein